MTKVYNGKKEVDLEIYRPLKMKNISVTRQLGGSKTGSKK